MIHVQPVSRQSVCKLHDLPSRVRIALGATVLLLSACGSDAAWRDGEPLRSVEAELSQAERMARYAQIRDAAATRGIDHTAYLLAGIAYAETNLAHCWSEATWACQGPNSADCGGGPVIAGAADGPCSDQQGGLGMFQFDAGTFTDTLNKYGADVLTVAGNTSHAIDYVINMVKISDYTTNAETNDKALAWINNFDINNGTLRDQWIKTVTHYYNGCKPSYSCWSQRYAHYNESLQYVIDETGLPFWVVVTDKAPTGYLDSASCDGIRGWAQDPDTPDQSIDVHLYFDSVPGDANAKTLVLNAGGHRDDLCSALGTCNHAYETPVPRSLMDGAQHTVHVFAINTSGVGPNPELTQSPATFQCNPPAPPVDAAHGVRRWVTTQEIFGAWKFSGFLDVAHVSDAELNAFPKGPDWPAAPLLAQGDDGSPEVWSIDGTSRRHVMSMDDLNAWRFDTAAIEKWSPSKLAAQESGLDWPHVPFLVQGTGPEVYVIDSSAAAGAAGAAGSSGAAGSAGAPGAGGSDAGTSDAGADAPPHAVFPPSSDDGGCSAAPLRQPPSAGVVLLAASALLAARRRRTRRSG